MQIRRLCAAVMVVLLAGTACGRDQGSNASNAPGSAAEGTKDTKSSDDPNGRAEPMKASAIYRVPVVPEARLEPDATGPGREVYRVPQILPETMFAFYDEEMPADQPFNGLTRCSESQTQTGPSRTYELTWRAPTANDFLVIQVVGYGDGPVGSLVSIIDDKANPARTCQPES